MRLLEDYTITEADPLTASISFIQPSCFGLSDGSATLSNGGTGLWNIFRVLLEKLDLLLIIFLQVFYANVTDANNCPASFALL